MSLRIVVYAEGRGDLAGIDDWLPVPGNPLPDDALGPAHILVRRSLVERADLRIPPEAVRFDSPLRLDARIPRGSDFLNRQNIRRLLQWNWPSRAPQLVVILIDQDGDRGRKGLVEGYVSDKPIPKVVAVSIQEFEAWLVADPGALREAMGTSAQDVGSPEKLKPGEAKRVLAQLMAETSVSQRGQDIRLTLASTCDLSVLASRCSAFDTFTKDLGHTAVAITS